MTDLSDVALRELAEKVAYGCDESGARHPAMACSSCIAVKFIALRDAAYAEQRDAILSLANAIQNATAETRVTDDGTLVPAGGRRSFD